MKRRVERWECTVCGKAELGPRLPPKWKSYLETDGEGYRVFYLCGPLCVEAFTAQLYLET